MNYLLSIKTPTQLTDLIGAETISLLDPQVLTHHAPDAHWVLVQDAEESGGREGEGRSPSARVIAYCSLWWQHTPPYPDQRLGLIGHYAAQNAAAASPLLHHAGQALAAQGCTMAVGPMDGNTWRRYRLLSDRGNEPIFFLEPNNPDDWCDHFREQGFTAFAGYRSAIATDLNQHDPRLERVEKRLHSLGVEVRSLDLQRFGQELQQIYTLSCISFRHNVLYTPIEPDEFMAQYSQIRPYVQPELVLMAEQDGNLVGFLFAIPDLLQAKRGEPINTIIIKTVAILPGRAYAGLGSFLVARVQAIAQHLGYSRAIHALMHDGNTSRHLSDRYAKTMRRYTLFAKELDF